MDHRKILKKMNVHIETLYQNHQKQVPGQWSEAEIKHQAEFLVACKLLNSGAICASPQVILVDKDWPQRQAFIDAVSNIFKNLPKLVTYYPGACEKNQFLCESNLKKKKLVAINFNPSMNKSFFFFTISGAEQRCSASKDCQAHFEEFVAAHSEKNAVKQLLFKDVPMGTHHLHQVEAFAPVLAETRIASNNNVEQFLSEALKFVNSDELFGSLSCSVIIDPRTEVLHKQAFEDFVAKLEYGCIAINEWVNFLNWFDVSSCHIQSRLIFFSHLSLFLYFRVALDPVTQDVNAKITMTIANPFFFFCLGLWGAFPKHSAEDIQSGMGKIGNTLMYDNVQKTVIRGTFFSMLHIPLPNASFSKVIRRTAYYSNYPTLTRFMGVLSAKLFGF